MIIGISGKKQSGKNTVADIWQCLDVYHNENNTLYEYFGSDISYVKYYLSLEYVNTSKFIKSSSSWECKAFSDKLKEIVCLIFGCTKVDLEDENFKNLKVSEEMNFTYRECLQKLGTDVFRNHFHENIWINALFSEYKRFIPTYVDLRCTKSSKVFEYPYWLITDVRFLNEVKAIKSKGGKVIKVERISKDSDTHRSEVELDKFNNFDFIIDNNKSIEELIKQVKNIMLKLNYIQEK
jgi:hypothetical protein